MEVIIGQIYKHFKGNMYKVICIAEDSETGKNLVIYQALYGENKIYARPYEMFISKVDKAKYPDVVQEYRFELWDSLSAVSPAPVPAPALTPATPAVNDESEDEELNIDPMVLQFLDADSFSDKLTILQNMKDHVDERMLNTMAFSMDLELGEGSVASKYSDLLNCVALREKFESSRLR